MNTLLENQRLHRIILNVVIFLFLSNQIFSQTTPTNLRSCDKINPVGTDDNPYFGWYFNDPDDDEIQTAYQVVVSSNADSLETTPDMWNSGQVSSNMQNYVFYQGESLSSGKKYYWQVRTWDKDGNESPYSEVGTFETGLFTNEDWAEAKWIRRTNTESDDYTYYRKSFTLNEAPQRAVVYVSAVHEFELYINGSLVGKGPGYHYPQYQYYHAYDITEQLNASSVNTLACLAHWYNEGQGRPKSERGFLLKAVIEYGGSTMVVGTDSTWKQQQAIAWQPRQKRRNGEGIGYVEKIDASTLLMDWYANDFDDSSWDNSDEIGAQPVSPWDNVLQPNLTRLIEEEIIPDTIVDLGNNNYVIDLGKIYAGVPRITFSGGDSGKILTIRGGFTLTSIGSVDINTTQNADMSYYFILNGDSATFQPVVYLGMRYIQVNSSPNVLTKDNVRFITRHYELDPSRSSFESSNEMLNAVWNLMKRSLLLGSQESFVDTPTREKGGFLGDSWSIGAAAMTTMYDRVMNYRILLEFLDSQEQYWPDGRLNAVYPNGDGARDIPDYTQMYLVWAWDYYMQTGNKEFLRKNYSKLKKVADYVDSYIDLGTGLLHDLDGGGGAYLYGIIDWPDQMRYGYDMEVVSRTVQDVYAYADFDIMSKIAEVVDSTDDKSIYAQKAESIKSAINEKLINGDGLYVDGLKSDLSQSDHTSQQANMFPMAMGLVPEESRDTVAGEIKWRRMSSGMVTVRMLPEALGEADEGYHLVNLYTNPEWDGWAKTISLGGTATWESWDANTNNQSLSHPWGAAGLQGIQKYIIGITPLKPQHELVQIKPIDCGQNLSYVNAVLPTDRGDIALDWDRSDSLFKMSFTIPDNVTAKVYVPMSETTGDSVLVDSVMVKGTIEGNYIYVGEMGSGTHTFERVADTFPTPPPLYMAPEPEPEPEPEGIKLLNGERVSIYPNPAFGEAMIDLGSMYPYVSVIIHSILGETVKNEIYTNSRFCNVDFTGLEDGIYFIDITTSSQESTTLRIVKN